MFSKVKLKFSLFALSIFCMCILSNIFTDNEKVSAMSSIDGSNIKVSLSSNTDVTVKEGESTNIKYSVKPQEYTTGIDEAVFLVDVSNNMKDKDNGTRGRGQFAQNVPVNINDLVNNSEKNLGISMNIKGTVIGFADDAYSLINQNLDKDMNNVQMRQSNNIDGIANNIIGTINNMSSKERNINNALEKADLLFQDSNNNTEKNRNKAIIIISSGKINNINSSTMNKIKNSGYRIIILDVSSSDDNSTDSESESNLKSVISNLSGDENYLFKEIHPSDSTSLSKDDKEKIAMNKNIYFKIIPKYNDYADSSVWRPALQSAIYGSVGNNVSDNSYKVENAKLTFDLGGNFQIGDRALIEYNGQKKYVNINTVGNNKINIDVSEFITYIKDAYGFKPTYDNIVVSFDVTAIGAGGTFGKDSDGKDLSKFSYKESLGNAEINREFPLETPIVRIGTNDKPQISIKLDRLKVNNVETKNYSNLCSGDEIEFTYKISAEDLQIEDINEEVKKDIVLILDTSGSMNFNFYNDSIPYNERDKRIYSLKQSAKQFINKFNNKDNIRIGIVPYSYYSGYANNIKQLTEINDNNKKSYESYIDNIKVEGATNQGDGIREAGKMLLNTDGNSKKYVILITDGEATAITIEKPNIIINDSAYYWANNVFSFRNGDLVSRQYWYGARYIDDYYNDIVYFNNGSSFYVNPIYDFNNVQNTRYVDFGDNRLNEIKIKKATDYATNIGRKLKQSIPELKVMTIGCALNESTVDLAKEVNNSMNGDYFSANDSNSMESIFDELADSILSDYDIKNVKLNFNIPEQFELSSNDSNIIDVGSSYEKSLPNIIYHLNYDKTKYSADPVYFTIKLKVKNNSNAGNVNFGNDSQVSYDSILNNRLSKELPIDKLRIINKRFPDIKVELQSPKDVNYDGNNIDIKYKINADSFSYEDIYGELNAKDIYWVIDSDAMKNFNIGNNIFNKIISDDKLKALKARYSFITYGDSNGDAEGIKYYNGTLDFRRTENEGVYGEYITNLINYASSQTSVMGKYNIVPALNKVRQINAEGRSDSNITELIDQNRKNTVDKYIVIVGKNSIDDSNQLGNIARQLKAEGYKIITLNLGDIPIRDNWKYQGGYTNSQEGLIDANNNLKDVHCKLSDIIMPGNETLDEKKDDNYFLKINYDKFNETKKNESQMNQFWNQQDNFSTNWLNNQISPEIANKFIGSITDEFKINNMKFSFDLQNKCILNGKSYTLNGINDIPNNDNNVIEFQIPGISYKFNSSTGEYENISFNKSNEPIMTLNIRPNYNIIEDFTFSNNEAFFRYNDIFYSKEESIKLETPNIRFNKNKERPDLF